MASAIIGGLIATGFPAQHIRVSDPNADGLARLAARYGVHTTHDNTIAADADILLLAVKPQVLQTVCTPLVTLVQTRRPLVISIAAGIGSAQVDAWLGGHLAVVRCMPNTPAMVGEGATGLFANTRVSPAQREAAESLFRSVGTTCWVDDESLMHAITAVSGSGPAYFFLILEALELAGTQAGLPAETARALAIQTMRGAARMARDSGEEPAQLKRNVMSPGGTTERAIQTFEQGDLVGLIGQAVAAANARSAELAEQLARQG
ncbi:MAG: pyrroline-5-carboxylate reductase [Gammaproteobacteria bacterium]|nr:pyrroline-5-carboxylate reductase [Gammaproteobacteria bacterium]